MFLEICMQIYSMVFALSRQINKQKYAKTVNLLCAGNELFVKYQAEGGVNPNPPLRTPLPPIENFPATVLCETQVMQRDSEF